MWWSQFRDLKVGEKLGVLAAVVALVPAISFVLKFLFDSGYGAYFNIPQSMTSFSPGSVFSIVPFIVASLFAWVLLIDLARPWKSENPLFPLEMNLLVLVYVATALNGIHADTYSRNASLLVLLVALYVVLRHFVLPVFTGTPKAKYWDKVKERVGYVRSKNQLIYDYVDSFAIYRESIIPLVVVGLCLTIYGLGIAAASLQGEYLVSQDEPDWVVVRLLDNQVVLRPVTSPGVVGNELRVRELTQGVILEPKKTGRLRMMK